MDDAPPLEKIEEKRVDMTKPVGPIMGRGMLWGREKRKEEPLKSPEGPGAKRARMMVSGLSEAKTMAKKDSADVINEFVDNIPDDGDEIRGVARISGLLLEIRALVRKHQGLFLLFCMMGMFCCLVPGAAAIKAGERGYVASLDTAGKCGPNLKWRGRNSDQTECLCLRQFREEKDKRARCEQKHSYYNVHDSWTDRGLCDERCNYRTWGPNKYGVFGSGTRQSGSVIAAMGFATLSWAMKNPKDNGFWFATGVVLVGVGTAQGQPVRTKRKTKSHRWVPDNLGELNREKLEASVSMRDLRDFMSAFAEKTEAEIDKKVEEVAKQNDEHGSQIDNVQDKIEQVHNETTAQLNENGKKMEEIGADAAKEIIALKQKDEDHETALEKHDNVTSDITGKLEDWMRQIRSGDAEAIVCLLGIIIGGAVLIMGLVFLMLCYRAVSLQAKMLSTAFQFIKWFVPNSGENEGGIPAGLYLQGFQMQEMPAQGQNGNNQPDLKKVKQEYSGHFAYVANQSGVFSVKT